MLIDGFYFGSLVCWIRNEAEEDRQVLAQLHPSQLAGINDRIHSINTWKWSSEFLQQSSFNEIRFDSKMRLWLRDESGRLIEVS